MAGKRTRRESKSAGTPAVRDRIRLSGIDIAWDVEKGTCSFEKLPVAMMWVDTTLAGLMSGLQAMVGAERFSLALQSEGRKSVEADWQVISQFPDFHEGYRAIAIIAAVAGWGDWRLVSLDDVNKRCCFHVTNSWEGRYQKALGVCWGSGMLAGKMAGYCSKLFGTNCWAEQTAFIARGDEYDEFAVGPSERSVETEIENLLATDEATRADMAVALQRLRKEVSVRESAERALRESEEKYRLLVENANDAIFIAQDEVIKFPNPKTEQMLGYSAAELGRSPFARFIHPEDREMVVDRNRRRLRGEKLPSTYSFRVLTQSGESLVVQINVVSIEWEGRPAALIFLRDITEQKRAEEELQKAAKLESIGLLAGGIAHDFNNILAGIMGYVSIAKRGLKGKRAHLLEEAERATVRARALTHQLLTFSKGGAPIKKTSTLPQLIRESTRFAVIGSKVRCRYEIAKGLWPAYVDRGQVSQVLHNLVLNAAHAMPDGGIVRVRATNVELAAGDGLPLPRGRYVEIRVQDHGVGIPEEMQARIFDPYFTTKAAGIGLGLATAYSIVRRHNGHIAVESKPGVGTHFAIYLPVAGEDPMRREDRAERPASLIKGRGKLLVMDDEKIVRNVAGEMVRFLGYEVAFARDGGEAIALYQDATEKGEPFDLVIMDLTVPGAMGGKEAIRKLKAIDPRVKAIVSSGYSNDPVVSEFAAYGFCGMVGKPFRMEELGQVLDEVLRGAERSSS
jgi:PAS domain S-box-containing protein